MKTIRTRAIVLKRTNYGEADRIIQLITPYGKRTVMAKGVRREKSRLAGGIELFAISEVVIGGGKGEIDILTSARLVHFFRHILENYDRLQFGYQAIKLISKASEMMDEPEWFDVLSETLCGLDTKSLSTQLTQAWFYLRYSTLMGYELCLTRDASGKELSSELRYGYDVGERGLVQRESGEITSEHIKLLRLIATKPLKILAQIGGIQDVIDDCFYIAREHAAV